ncbi:MAG TPA: MotA/TolQ/ExbB proton channel family protein [Oligoflexia bacterium]|nr:MotA/TolQ/ExbB proton channel family protein [Oligoflexia bacterium]HMP48221.1 MotA/TolQ/ExbB proton channel family protein [Oligoflexia bacterium]
MWDLIERGGPIIWPLILTSILTFTVILERSLFLLRLKLKQSPDKREHFHLLLSEGRLNEAVSLAKVSNDPVLQVVFESFHQKREAFSIRYQKKARTLLGSIHRGVPILDTAITIAPLLGLLGTVVGLIHSFYSIGESSITAPIAITGGISEALIATAFGLGIAIVALIPYNVLNEIEEKTREELEILGNNIEELLNKQENHDGEKQRKDITLV